MFRTAKSNTLKRGRDVVSAVRKMVRINRDLLPADQMAALSQICDEIGEAVKRKDAEAVAQLCDKLEEKADRVFPEQPHASLRENVEVLLVAVIVAMAVRTFFVQPFKIPTGSMQPTLYGIYPPPAQPSIPFERGTPNILERILGMVLYGRMYDGNGYRTRGDHIFVDKLTYHFRQPRRGDVIVFETNHIEEMRAESRGKFYIKRLIGLGGDTIQIKPPHVLVNGEVLDGRPAFKRLYSMKDGYKGYQNYTGSSRYPQWPTYLFNPEETLKIREGHLFVLGDNTLNSSDGRYWRDFERRDLIGKAIFVYWPFSDRFGLID
jgi:signal peptidase I